MLSCILVLNQSAYDHAADRENIVPSFMILAEDEEQAKVVNLRLKTLGYRNDSRHF
jgi:hypothetical protein